MQCNSDNIPLCPPCNGDGGECDWSTLCELFPEMSSELQAELRLCIITNSNNEQIYIILDGLGRLCSFLEEYDIAVLQDCLLLSGQLCEVLAITTANEIYLCLNTNNQLCDLLAEYSSAQIKSCLVGNGTLCDVVAELSNTDLEECLDYDQRSQLTGIKSLPTGNGQTNYSGGGGVTGVASVSAFDDGAFCGDANRNERNHRLGQNSFFNLGYTSKFISDLGGTHEKRMVGISGSYWDETDGLYYDITGAEIVAGGSPSANMLLAFPERYLIDLATGLGWAFAISGTFGGINWANLNPLSSHLTLADAYSITVGGNTYDNFRVPQRHEMDGIVFKGNDAIATMRHYGPFSSTWGGPISTTVRWNTNTFQNSTQNFFVVGGSQQINSHTWNSITATAQVLLCRPHLSF